MNRIHAAIVMCVAVFWFGCPPGQPPAASFSFDSTGSAASVGNYAATCQQLRMSQPRVRSIAPGTFTLSFPASGGSDGTIRDLSVSAVFESDLEVGTSPVIFMGPPVCAATAPAFLGAAVFVVDVVVTGSIDWNFGTENVTEGVLQKNAVIKASTLQLPTFNVHNAAPLFDGLARDLARRQVQCAVDAAVVEFMNNRLLEITGGSLNSGLPVYAPGVHPHGGC